MFDEQENDNFEMINDWFDGVWGSRYQNENKNVWDKRFKCFFFFCMKNETVDVLENRFDCLIEKLKLYEIRM
ncbi:hypothetical protein HanRHA438_Chr11g0494061 [Helianthus annuus]|nr:hypothetical protein HanRHA438_Chr11g0494061 [Helianthus annuus]